MHFTPADIFTGANLLVALAFYRKASIFVYQHKLMWADWSAKKAISPKANGASVGSE